ncbi:MAG: cache domain-containing protein [Treponema sp.]
MIDKAENTAYIIDGRISSLFQFLEGISRLPFLRSSQLSDLEKAKLLKNETMFNKTFKNICAIEASNGVYLQNGKKVSYSNEKWFLKTKNGENCLTEPFYDKLNNNDFVMRLSVPIYDNKKTIVGVLYADIDGCWLSNNIKDISVGQTGYCYILAKNGVTIADEENECVKDFENTIEASKNNSTLLSQAEMEKIALESNAKIVGKWTLNGINYLSSSAKLKFNGWVVFIQAPVKELNS